MEMAQGQEVEDLKFQLQQSSLLIQALEVDLGHSREEIKALRNLSSIHQSQAQNEVTLSRIGFARHRSILVLTRPLVHNCRLMLTRAFY